MKRRNFLSTGMSAAAAAGLTASAAETATKPVIYELRTFKLRNTRDNQRARLAEYLGTHAVPAMQKAGVGPIGLFAVSIAADSPAYVLIAAHASMAAFEATHEKLWDNPEFAAASEKFLSGPGLPYERVDVELLRAFAGFPEMQVPPAEAGRAPRVFELRTYESNTSLTLRRKIGMFEGGEIDIFRESGMFPVLFSYGLAGTRLPKLTYMLAFDSLAAREAHWKTFATSPKWKALSSKPGLSDGEIVSNISNAILSPLPGSMLR